MTVDVRPPAHVQPYVDALGVEAAVTFFLTFGGAELYMADDPKGGSRLVDVLGIDAARALAALAGRTQLPRRVPIPKPWIACHLKARHHLSHAEIARRLHASDVAVRRWIAKGGSGALAPTDQLSLF